jgi:twitching motility protein PilJ
MNLSRLNFLDRMRLWQKFLLLGVFVLAAVLFPFYRYIGGAEADIQFSRDERGGIPPIVALAKLVQAAQLHRGLTAAVLGGDTSAANARSAQEAEVDKLMAQADRALAAEDFARMRDDWARIKHEWTSVRDALAQAKADSRASYQSQTSFIEHLLLAVEQVADLSKLSLDPAAHTYFLMNTFTVHLPKLTESLGQARAQGTAAMVEAARLRASGNDPARAFSDADRVRMVTTLRNVQTYSDDAARFLAKVVREEPRLKGRIEAELAGPRELVRQLVQLAQKELVEARAPSFDSTAFLTTFTQGIDAQFKLLHGVAQLMDEELELQIAGKRRAEFEISIQILAALFVAGWVGVLTVRNVRRTVHRLQRSVDKVRGGDVTALQNIEAKDEVGDLGRTVNELLTDRLAAQRKAEDENESLNRSVIQLLEAVHMLSKRDLTSRAPVTQDVIGTVSDSINALAEETSKVLQSVSLIAAQVAQASGNVRSQAALVSQTAQDERSSIDQMVESLAQATRTMNRVTSLAEQSSQSATQATLATDTALETVNGTVRGMESIRETIAETEKRIKRLGERSQEISGIVNLINTISERTHVLALNASMQAAVAGEAGRGFAVVAEEVQRLAESSRNATQQIATLVNNIQVETNETISTVNRTISQVVEGSGLAQKAGEQMRRTQQITAELVANVQRITDASEEQKVTSDRLLTAARHIGESTQRTGEQIDTQNRETETLLKSARHLLDSVNVFKLPQPA